MPEGEILPFGAPRAVTALRSGDRLERQPPYSVEAEQTVLGGLLIDSRRFDRIGDLLEPCHFGNAMHGRIFEAIAKLAGSGRVATPITLAEVFNEDGALTDIGGAQYLGRLAAAAAMIIELGDYARVVRDLYTRRELIALREDIVNDAYRPDLDDPAEAKLARAEDKLFHLATRGRVDPGFRGDRKSVV